MFSNFSPRADFNRKSALAFCIFDFNDDGKICEDAANWRSKTPRAIRVTIRHAPSTYCFTAARPSFLNASARGTLWRE